MAPFHSTAVVQVDVCDYGHYADANCLSVDLSLQSFCLSVFIHFVCLSVPEQDGTGPVRVSTWLLLAVQERCP